MKIDTTDTRRFLAQYTIERNAALLTNMNMGLDAQGNVWDESELGPIGPARLRIAIRLDAARDRLDGIEAGKTGWNF